MFFGGSDWKGGTHGLKGNNWTVATGLDLYHYFLLAWDQCLIERRTCIGNSMENGCCWVNTIATDFYIF